MNEQQRAMRNLQTLDFCLLETVHYLNGHPGCKDALDYYQQIRKEALAARNAYEEAYAPITMYGCNDSDCWEWVMSPWPWECEAN